ncbi:hypothetical protein JL722_14722 [Aureococcus anophagefferens]|nr:hypothetical protein JL722_14722 [Aureococcus anophagefferens]
MDLMERLVAPSDDSECIVTQPCRIDDDKCITIAQPCDDDESIVAQPCRTDDDKCITIAQPCDDSESIVAQSHGAPYFCALCRLALGSEAQALEHLAGKRHARVRRHASSGLVCPRFDAALRSAGVRRILAIGDCHGGKALGLFLTLVRSHFEGGSMYSWVHGKRSLPPVESVLVKSDRRGPGVVVIAFSYGEIDCRCHARTEALAAPDALSGVTSRIEATPRARPRSARVVAVALAVPPASDQGRDNPRAPFVGRLAARRGGGASTRARACVPRFHRRLPRRGRVALRRGPGDGRLRADMPTATSTSPRRPAGPSTPLRAMLGAVT